MDTNYIMTEEEMRDNYIYITDVKFDKGFVCEGKKVVLIAQQLDDRLYKINSIHKIK